MEMTSLSLVADKSCGAGRFGGGCIMMLSNKSPKCLESLDCVSHAWKYIKVHRRLYLKYTFELCITCPKIHQIASSIITKIYLQIGQVVRGRQIREQKSKCLESLNCVSHAWKHVKVHRRLYLEYTFELCITCPKIY